MGMRVERWVAGAVIVSAIALIYARALSAPFIFDDHSAILDNRTIRSFRPIRNVLMGPPQTPVAGRPLVNLSLALNYAIDGLNPRGYHIMNVALHACSALLLLGVIARTLGQSPWGIRRGYTRRAALAIATIIALLWAVHPLNSEAVEYVTQRTELLAALFYLLTIYCALRGWGPAASNPIGPDARSDADTARARSSGWWFAAAVVACAAGMASKEVMVGAPVAVLLYDRAFVSGSLVGALRRSPRLYAGLALTWLILLLLAAAGSRSQSILWSPRIAADYLLTQTGVLVHYLRLVFWPSGLTISYDWPLVHSLGQVWPQALMMAALLAATGWAFWRRPALGFLGAVFFMVLAPSSSLLPVVTEVAAERRMYLPSAAVAALVIVCAWMVVKACAHAKAPRSPNPCALFGGVAVLAAVLGMATNGRLAAYRSELAIWEDAVAKNPASHSAQANLGTALYRVGRIDEAIACYRQALALAPDDFEAHNSLGVALLGAGKVDQAVAEFAAAVRASPRYADACYNWANALVRQGRLDEAAGLYVRSLEIAPDNADAWLNLGDVHLLRERYRAAAEALAQALRLQPQSDVVRVALAGALGGEGRLNEAARQLAQVLAVDPDNVAAQNGLGRVRLLEHQPQDAEAHFRRAVELSPGDAQAWDGLGEALAVRHQMAQALDCFKRAIALRPGFTQARNHRDQAARILSQAATRPAR